MEATRRSLALPQTWLYSAASVGLNLMSITVSTWLLYFYAPPADSGRIQYLPAEWVGLLLLCGGLWDAVIDPFIGHWSDTRTSARGRRRPFLLFGAPAAALLLVLLWTPPQGNTLLTGAYLILVSLGYFTAFSLVGIPYDATLPEMAPDSHARVGLSYWKNLFGIFGVLIGSLVVAPLFSAGPVLMGIVVGIASTLTIWLTLLALRESPPPATAAPRLNPLEGVLTTLQNRQFIILFVSTLLIHLAYQMFLANLPYFVTLVVGRAEGDVGIFQGIIILGMVLAGPLWGWLNRRYSQRTLLLATMVGLGLGAFLIFGGTGFMLLSPLAQGILLMIPAAIMLGGYFILVYAMMGNVVDYDEMLTGARREAIYYGAFSLANGLGISLGILILPQLLERFGYTAQNPLGVRVVFVAVGIAALLGALAFLPYRLGDTPAETRRALEL